MKLLAPSILSADFGHLAAAVQLINQSEADWIHCDIMDGQFVPNISFGLPVLAAIKRVATKPLDVHLMIDRPERYINEFKLAGADILSVHVEGAVHLHRTIMAIREAGMQAGVVLNPATPVTALQEILPNVNLVCLMTVNPGFGGQQFISTGLEKLRRLCQLRDAISPRVLVEVDGGVSKANLAELAQAGADVLVAGNAVFGAQDPSQAIADLKAAANAGSQQQA